MSANLFIGRETKSTVSKQYVEKYKDNLFLSNIRWGGGDGDQLSFARVNWHHHDAFMKCGKTSEEVKAFNALMTAKNSLTNDYAIGRENVMDPLHRFAFTEASTNAQAYIAVARIFPDIIKGLMYLHNAGILYHDTLIPNVMMQLDSNRNVVGAKIIDLDRISIFKKEQGWQPINLNDQEYLSLNPRQRYDSCMEPKTAMVMFLGLFVVLSSWSPFENDNVLDDSAAVKHLNQFIKILDYYDLRKKPAGDLMSLPSDVRPALPEMLRLVRMMYTLVKDPFACTSPIRALKGLPPRTL
ncbi:hypothetical protein BDF22DRAFT_733933 [Syncephalis plumigaleata]|nr:hypothetical protein BDF22DRAFT_733933 [Syncephalis plumigaleata]